MEVDAENVADVSAAELMLNEKHGEQGRPAEISGATGFARQDNIIDFAENDPADPLNWHPRHKLVILSLSLVLTFMATFGTLITAPSSPQILSELHSDNTLYRALLTSIWEMGEIFGPLVWGPLSELYGRLPIIHTANVAFVCFLVGGALSTNIQMVIAFRFLAGVASAAPTLAPAIIGDLYRKEERGAALTTMMFGAIFGTVIGPIAGGYLGQNLGWRWSFWVTAMIAAAATILLMIVYRETYRVRILARMAGRRRLEDDNPELRSKYATNEESAPKVFYQAIVRPTRLLVTSPMLAILTLYISFTQGLMYLTLTIISPIFQDTYGFSEEDSGLAYLGLSIGFGISLFGCRLLLDILVRRKKSRSEEIMPEQRLPLLILTCITMPVGLFLFGWSAQYRVQWIVPIIGTAIIGIAQVATSIATRSYIIDAFGIYGASAVAAMLVPLNTTSALLPLAGAPLYTRLGLGWGNSLLAFIAIACVPIPITLLICGKRIRESKALMVTE